MSVIELTVTTDDVDVSLSTTDDSTSTDLAVSGVVETNVVTNDYEDLINKPSINGVELYKGTTLGSIGFSEITNAEIDVMFK